MKIATQTPKAEPKEYVKCTLLYCTLFREISGWAWHETQQARSAAKRLILKVPGRMSLVLWRLIAAAETLKCLTSDLTNHRACQRPGSL